mgnify:FL=1
MHHPQRDRWDGVGWAEVCDWWGLEPHLRVAVLNIWNGCPASAADCVQREIDRLIEVDVKVSRMMELCALKMKDSSE